MKDINCPICGGPCSVHDAPGGMQRTVCAMCGSSCSEPRTTVSIYADAPLETEIRDKCQALADFLVEKNRAYGNSAAEPINVFARRLDTLAQIDTRIDDKLNRLAKGSEYPGDDTVLDLAGYLVLRMIVKEQQDD